MKLEKHIVDTIKEWQLKLGDIDDHVCLYYPLDSICGYLGVQHGTDRDSLLHLTGRYLKENAPYLGNVRLSCPDDRMCIDVPAEGCCFVKQNVEIPEFLREFLSVLKEQDMDKIKALFYKYAESGNGAAVEDREADGLGTVLYFDRDDIYPYVYCIDQDVFGITYHRFAKSDYEKLKG